MADRTPAQIGASNRRRGKDAERKVAQYLEAHGLGNGRRNLAGGRMARENVSAPGAVGAAPELASTALGGADMPDATCSIDGCTKPVHGRGWCSTHYMRWRRNGTTDDLRPTAADRFWSRTSRQPDGCWLWTGSVHPNGYGRISVDNKWTWVHRFAYDLLVGPIPAGLTIDHLCRNTLCVRPDHLEAVTAAENLRREVEANRGDHCSHGHPFDSRNTYITPEGHRSCRACRRETSRRARALA